MATNTARTNITSVLTWDKTQQQLKPIGKKNNPILWVAAAAMVILAVSGLWRASHKSSAVQMIQVLAAQRDIPAGTRLGFTNLRFFEVPRQFATRDMITSLNVATGHITRTFIPAGEPVRDFMLLPQRDGLSVNLETHERAITLQLDDDALVDHSVLPEDRVDLLVVTNKNSKKYTKTICQSVRVLMVAPKEQLLARSNAGNSNNKITLAVTPDVAEVITEALESGKIRLVLRSRLSRTEQHLQGSSQEDLLPASAAAAEQIPAAPPAMAELAPPPPAVQEAETPIAAPPSTPLQWMVEVISGNHKETYGVPAQ